MPLRPDQLFDPMPDTKKYFRRTMIGAPVDYESFGISLRQCTMESCCGMCCYDGVCLDEDEEHYIGAVIDAHPVFFKEEMGITRGNAFEDAEFLGSDCRKTATRKFKYPAATGFPKHFDNTKCAFRYDDGRCSLQSLAMQHGEHPWAYKPPSCWLHPVSLERDNATILWLPQKHTDHLVEKGYPGYAPFTKCGEDCGAQGMPAYEALKPELETLGVLVGRDFYTEIKTWHEQGPDAVQPLVSKKKKKHDDGKKKKKKKKKR